MLCLFCYHCANILCMRLVDFSEVPDLELAYPLFFQKNYAAYEQTRGWQVKLFTNGKGYLPLKLKRNKFIMQGQYLYPPLNNGERLDEQDEKAFLNTFVDFCRHNNVCDFIIPPVHYSLFSAVPAGSFYTDLGIIVVNLRQTEEDLFRGFNPNYRNEIRKAQAAGVEIKFDNAFFETFYTLYKNTHARQGIYFDPKQELQNLIETLGTKSCIIAVAVKGEEVHGASLITFSGHEGYYYQSGAIENSPYPGANKLLQLEAMKFLKTKGITRYVMGGNRLGDIAGTKYEGIQKFKLRFGAQIEKGFSFYTRITWRYTIYAKVLEFYLALRGVKQNTTGLNYRYN